MRRIPRGWPGLKAGFYPTNRNIPVRDVYERHGFTVAETTDEGVRWRLDLKEGNPVIAPEWLEIADAT